MRKTAGSAQGSRFTRLLIGRNPRVTLVRALLLAALALLTFHFVLLVVWVDGYSMEPTIHANTMHLADLWEYRGGEPACGDIVVISMAGRRVMYLKRVLGVPGDLIQFRNGVFYVDDKPLPEPYLVNRGDWSTGTYRLGPDEFYVAGDNRRMPIELHETGIVDRQHIIGSLLF